jgi:hypothetical protein
MLRNASPGVFNSNQWSISKERYKAFLSCENEKVLMAVTCLRDGTHYAARQPPVSSPEAIHEWYLDAQGVYDRCIERIAATNYYGQAFPFAASYFGTGGDAKYFKGSYYQFTGETVWFFPSLEYGDLPEYLGPDSILSDELEYVRQLGKLGLGKYLVAVPDNCGMVDTLANLCGSEALLEYMIEDPDWVKACLRRVMDAYFDSTSRFYESLSENNFGGSTQGWMQLWVDGKLQHLQADFCVMISPKMFEEFILPDLEEACDWLDYSVYHFDGQEQIRHLDMLLSVKNLNTIQWTHVAGQPDFTAFIPVYKKIQAAGKGLIMAPTSVKQAKELLDNLKPQGLYLTITANNEAEAMEYLSL